MLTIFAACVKFVLFSSKSAAPADQCHNVPNPAPACASSAGCKQKNASCFYTSFTENLLFFLLSNHGWLNFIEEFFSLPTPLGFRCTCPLPRKGGGKYSHIRVLTTVGGCWTLWVAVRICDKKSPSWKSQMLSRVKECLGWGRNAQCVEGLAFLP